ncbi:MAG TPA: zf-HC2 domain-containing protein [Methylomirabilota bacterium]|nr:zf-HC2 domain-containing protein [Methylomirabilota bacterium]
MDCGAVRERFPALLRGRATLTDYALIEAHVAHCATCRQELKQRQQSVHRRRRRARTSERLKRIGAVAVTLVLGMALAAYLVYRLPKFQQFFRTPAIPFESVAPPPASPPQKSAPASYSRDPGQRLR